MVDRDELPRPGASRDFEQARGRLQLQGGNYDRAAQSGRGYKTPGRVVTRARVQIKRLNVVSCDSGPGPGLDADSACSVHRNESPHRELLVGRSVSVTECVRVCVSVSGCSAKRRAVSQSVSQSAAGRSVGESRDSRAVKSLSNGVSDMTEGSGVERRRRGE